MRRGASLSVRKDFTCLVFTLKNPNIQWERILAIKSEKKIAEGEEKEYKGDQWKCKEFERGDEKQSNQVMQGNTNWNNSSALFLSD